ncbi:MAG: cation:proton antiporter subunit C [Candidatus Loosdrechtia sp.]|uniref:cation:proton antiporter subunit C n=1 Tax=Candidatus Loosdrechtia sp. TaxID=3101272 RepID=UPI003A7980D6|nr:MAG: cation:proton antiporter subunit C [Candidatus Jettenia sp. AMX2]
MADFFLHGKLIYLLTMLLFLLGIYGMASKGNLLKQLMAMNVMETSAIIMFLILSQKIGATAPILMKDITDPDHYVNPLPHAIMLTAVVVGISLTGIGLALIKRIEHDYGSGEEDEIMKRMQQ